MHPRAELDRTLRQERAKPSAEPTPEPVLPTSPELALRLQRTVGNQALQRMLRLGTAPSRQVLRNGDGIGGMLAGTGPPADVGASILLDLPARDFFRQRQVSTQMRDRIDGILVYLLGPGAPGFIPELFRRFASLRDIQMVTLVPVFRMIPSGLSEPQRESLIKFTLLRPLNEWPTLVKCTPIGAIEIAEKLRLEDELACAARSGTEKDLIELVFMTLPPSQLGKLPTSDSAPTWTLFKSASLLLAGLGGMPRWLPKFGLSVCELPGFQMLLTDKSSMAADQQAHLRLQTAPDLPKFAGKSYDEIVVMLVDLGFQRKEKYTDKREKAVEAYGQDVWTHDACLLVRIKVGGASLKGRFIRPPHVVKELTFTPHASTPGDVICKMTDDNILIPAGTKFSAKDMQTWYERITKTKLATDAWKKPATCGDQFFIDLVQLWAEGAHTGIGAVPNF